MKRWFSLLIVLSLILSAPAPALAWGPDGHKAVGRIADQFLRDHNATNTLNRIRQILRQNESLSGVSIWADIIKGLQTGPNVTNTDSDTQAFLRDPRNKNHRDWHFVDIPLDCEGYDACSVAPIKFNNASDLVQMINVCVSALRSNAANPRLSKRNALRMLVHLLGDLHQPLHVGSGFINPNGPEDAIVFATDPAFIKQNGLNHDQGGNMLLIEPARRDRLHGFWDGDLVKALIGNQTPALFADSLKNSVAVNEANWNGQGNFRTWANQWASDSIKLSRNHAYDIPNGGVRIVDSFNSQEVVVEAEAVRFGVELADGYKDKNKEIVRVQLVKGGYRLAKLLEAIFP